MDLQTFRSMFPAIRVHLDWNALTSVAQPIQTIVLTEPAELGQIYSAF